MGMREKARPFWADESGSRTTEYVPVVGIVAVAIVAAVALAGWERVVRWMSDFNPV